MVNNNIEIISVRECLNKKINIPEYQRPYKWRVNNITDLLLDIEQAICEKRLYTDFKYRMGTIILHKEGDTFQIVDGQQRIISLTLLNLFLDRNFENIISNNIFTDTETLQNIHQNYQCIKEWFSLRKEEDKTSFINALKDILEVVVIYVSKETEAFQLFDSQNTRGRTLEPHDLLKAYHLREMQGDSYEMEYEVNNWEAQDVAKICEIFSDYLFPIGNWSRGHKTWTFTDKDIDIFKGISANCPYTFARRAQKAMPCFQITEPFVAGRDFFEMVQHYLKLLKNIESELKTNPSLEEIRPYFEYEHFSIGLKHIRKLYKAALLLYYDRFHMLDILALKKLFMWAFMLRIELENVSYDSVNKYAVGNGVYNSIPIFSIISQARRHTDIGNIIIELPEEIWCNNCAEERNQLHNLLKTMKQQ